MSSVPRDEDDPVMEDPSEDATKAKLPDAIEKAVQEAASLPAAASEGPPPRPVIYDALKSSASSKKSTSSKQPTKSVTSAKGEDLSEKLKSARKFHQARRAGKAALEKEMMTNPLAQKGAGSVPGIDTSRLHSMLTAGGAQQREFMRKQLSGMGGPFEAMFDHVMNNKGSLDPSQFPDHLKGQISTMAKGVAGQHGWEVDDEEDDGEEEDDKNGSADKGRQEEPAKKEPSAKKIAVKEAVNKVVADAVADAKKDNSKSKRNKKKRDNYRKKQKELAKEAKKASGAKASAPAVASPKVDTNVN